MEAHLITRNRKQTRIVVVGIYKQRSSHQQSEVNMTIDNALKQEVLTRLLHAHPAGLGKEVLDNYRGENAVADTLEHLQQAGLIHDGCVHHPSEADRTLKYPVKLSSSGVVAAKQLEAGLTKH
jgi:hypothetical protein